MGFRDQAAITIQGVNPRHGCEVRRVAAQSIPNVAATLISWDTETVDTDGFIVVPDTLITIPAGFAGLYLVTAAANYAANVAGANRDLDLILNGVTIVAGRHHAPTAVAGNQTRTQIGFVLPLNVGDTLSVQVFQNSGGALNLNSAMIGCYRVAA